MFQVGGVESEGPDQAVTRFGPTEEVVRPQAPAESTAASRSFATDQSKNPPPRNTLDRVLRRFARASYFAAVLMLYAVVSTALGLALAPGLLLFVYGSELLQGWVDQWLNEPEIRQVLREGIARGDRPRPPPRSARRARAPPRRRRPPRRSPAPAGWPCPGSRRDPGRSCRYMRYFKGQKRHLQKQNQI